MKGARFRHDTAEDRRVRRMEARALDLHRTVAVLIGWHERLNMVGGDRALSPGPRAIRQRVIDDAARLIADIDSDERIARQAGASFTEANT